MSDDVIEYSLLDRATLQRFAGLEISD